MNDRSKKMMMIGLTGLTLLFAISPLMANEAEKTVIKTWEKPRAAIVLAADDPQSHIPSQLLQQLD